VWLKKYEQAILACVGIVVSIILFWLALISPGVEGGMDSYNHYLIARNTWNHPHLFLDQWGKPLYNILASPFAQFGLHGIALFNIICLIWSSFLAYFIAKKIVPQFAFFAFIISIFSPVFLDITISGLTEPLCALWVTYSIYLLVVERYSRAALFAGFLPFARSEGFIILGIILLFLLIKREFRSSLYLAFGSIFFNSLGWLIEKEPFWIITKNPYINFAMTGRNVCGSGNLSHFLYAGHYTFGQVTCVLLLGAAALLAWHVYKKGIKPNLDLLLVFAVFASYFLAHVLLWWLGMMGSCGYIRVMAVVSPMVAILAAFTVTLMSRFILNSTLPFKQLINQLFISLLVINAIYVPYRYYAYKYPLTISAEQEQYVKAAAWYREQDFEERTKVVLYPYFSILADLDPYDKTQLLEFWESSFEFTKKGDILFWDSHFGPHECSTPLATLENNPKWKKIHSILPTQKIPTVNNAAFEIHIFEKIE
jgi:hypothetical protein